MSHIVTPLSKLEILARLRQDILGLNGIRAVGNSALDLELGTIREAFPNATFPLGAVHEFITNRKEEATATSGFIAALLSALLGRNGAAVWVSSGRILFPPALKSFGIDPDRIIFIDLKCEKDVLWVLDDALKCGTLTAVVGEIQKISFTESRRLQLAVEQSQVNGFIIRNNLRNPGTTSFVSRWRVTPMPSELADGLPGVGFPTWKVELLRIRNGRPGVWEIQWKEGGFKPLDEIQSTPSEQQRKAG